MSKDHPDEVSLEPTKPLPPESGEPDRIGKYRILEKIGEGGMGEVYLAEQDDPRRKVGLKIIKWGMDTKQVVARFEAERQALALMDHPNIAKVFDAGATAQGRPYFVMEYVKGVPITEHCDRHRLTTRQRLELFVQVCEGVQHAHQKAVIHRDLKPSNVLVAIQDGKPVPKIIDFGVAKATAQRLTEKTMFTAMGAMVGTPEYMSPEQADLTSQDIDTRTDVYSLGLILYQLLVGSLPFDPKALRQAGLDEIRRRISEDEPTLPSRRLTTRGDDSVESATRRRTDVASLARQLQGDLDWITMKALEKDRARRYGSPAEFAADIGRHLEYDPVLAGPQSKVYRLTKFVRRHRVGVAATAVALLALVIGAATATVGLVRAMQAETVARQEAARANQEAETARQVSEFLVGIFEVSDPFGTRENTVTVRELLDAGAARIEQELSDHPLVKARMMNTMGRVYMTLKLYDEADRLLVDALEIRERERGPRHVEVAESLENLGWLRYNQGQPDGARDYGERALALYRELVGPDHIDTARSSHLLGVAMAHFGEPEEGEPLLFAALAVYERELGPDHQRVAWCLNDLGVSSFWKSNWTEARTYFERALSIKERTLGQDHPDVAIGLNNIAYTLLQSGEYAEARPIAQRALDIVVRTLGLEHGVTANFLQSLGELMLRAGDLEEARDTLERARQIQEDWSDENTSEAALTLHTLAGVHQAMADYETAESFYRRALAIRELLGANHPDLLISLEAYASMLRTMGRDAEAEEIEKRAQAIPGAPGG
jgi:serine/threonine protein kinase/tetratricopeptide (TPR) repeat protein